MASEALRLQLSKEQLEWLRRGGRGLLRNEVAKLLDEECGVEVLRFCLLLPTDILVSILNAAGEGTRYYFDEDDPLAEVYYRKNREHFSATEVAVEKGLAGDVYGLRPDEVYLRFDYRGDIKAVRERVLELLTRMPPA
ncbi:MAG: hypothetical protein ACE5LD_01205 [Candidatus Bipolaricaulia bacterium]